jgi:hypothetical protein
MKRLPGFDPALLPFSLPSEFLNPSLSLCLIYKGGVRGIQQGDFHRSRKAQRP